MASIIIEKEVKENPHKVFQQLRVILENDLMLKDLDHSYKCQFDSDKLEGSAKGGKFKANMKVFPHNNGSKIVLKVELSFILGAFKEKVRKALVEKLETHLVS